MTQKIKIALIYGSTREGRFCDTVVDWAAREIDNHGGFTLDLIDPAALTLPGQDQGKTDLSANALQERIELADAFVVVTPEYNHGYTAGLKFLIDSVYSQWHAKPVAFVSYGGISDGLRAVEQLRLVFAELHAVTVRDSISFPNYRELFDSAGELRDAAHAKKPMARMLEHLRWWANALREARRIAPYQEIAI